MPWKCGSTIYRSVDSISKSKIQKKSSTTISLREGWPVKVGLWPMYPVAADLTGDGRKEIVIADREGYLYIFKDNGQYLSEIWPKKLGLILSSPVIADIDKDGDPEIVVVASISEKQWPNGWVHVLEIDGEHLPGWPIVLDGYHHWINGVSVADINNDGFLNIVTATGGAGGVGEGKIIYNKKVYAFSRDGSLVPGWPVEPAANRDTTMVPRSPLVLADLNQDNHLEIIGGFFSMGNSDENVHTLYTLNSFGETMPGFPVVTRDWNYALASADMDNDGFYEIYCHGQKYDRFGNKDTNWKRQEGVISYLAFADVNNNGYPELIYGWGEVHVVDRYGIELPGWPQDTDSYGDGNPVAGDIDGDGDIEILIGAAGTNKIFAWHHDGSQVEGFPLTTGDENRRIAISDLDGDGSIELISACSDSLVYVFDIPASGPCEKMEWPMYQHDQYHTGVYPSKHGTPVIEEPGKAARSFRLEQNYPNPFNPSTEIRFVLPRAARVNLSVYNTLGQRIRTLETGFLAAGTHSALWDGRDHRGHPVPSGVYVCRLHAGENVMTRKVMVVR